MNDMLAPSKPEAEVKTSPWVDSCPSCSMATQLRGIFKDDDLNNPIGLEEVCPICGPVAELLSDRPVEDNPKPVDPKKAGKAQLPAWIKAMRAGVDAMNIEDAFANYERQAAK